MIELLYKASVYELDALFGGVIEAIEERGLIDASAIAFTSDHGEILYRDNALFQWGHGYQQAPEVIGVPFLLRAPGLPAGRFDHVTRSTDVYPTLAGLAGVAAPVWRARMGVPLGCGVPASEGRDLVSVAAHRRVRRGRRMSLLCGGGPRGRSATL